MLVALLSAAAQSPSPALDLQPALQLFNSGAYERCLVVITSYLKDHPVSASALKILGMDEFMLGQRDQAQIHLLRATQLAPTDADAFYYLGRLYFSADNAVAAESAFRKALALDPGSVRAENNLGQSLEALGRPKDAEIAYKKAIQLDQEHSKKSEWPYYNLGVLYVRNGLSERAIPLFREALACNPDFAEAKIKLATALSGQNQMSDARKLLEETIQAEPHNAEAHYRLALLLAKSGKREEAQQQFELFDRYRKP